MEEIISTLKMQYAAIAALRKGLNQLQPEPKEATEGFKILEDNYTNALIKCGEISFRLEDI